MNIEQQASLDRQTNETPTDETPKKQYETPTVTVHGTVADITRNTGPFGVDGLTGDTFSLPSDRAVKQDFAAVDPRDVLTRLAAMPVESWSYKFQNPSVRHIGPMAQDFAAAFGVGESDRTINMVDASGVSLAAIQALYAMLQERDARIAELRAEVEDIKRRIPN